MSGASAAWLAAVPPADYINTCIKKGLAATISNTGARSHQSHEDYDPRAAQSDRGA